VATALAVGHLACTAFPASGASDSGAGLGLAEADAAYAAGQWVSAMAGYDRALRADPSLAVAAFRRGRCAANLGLTAQATDSFRRAVALSPGSALAHGELGDALRRERRVDAAEEHYLRALELSQGDGAAVWLVGLGLVELSRGRAESASERFSAARDASPAAPEPHYNLGDALLRQNLTADARAAFAAAIKTDATFALAHFGLGRSWERSRNLPEALRCYTQASERDPAEPAFHAARARAMRRTGDLPGAALARDAFRQATAIKYLSAGKALMAVGQWRDALARLLIARNADPSSPDIAMETATAYLRLGEPAAAEEALGVAEATDRQGTRRHRLLAEALLARGDTGRAVASVTEALERRPTWAPGLWLRGIARERLGDSVGAEADLRAAIGVAPDAIPPKAALARLLALNNRDIALAYDLAVSALTADPTPTRRATLALVYLRMGEANQARLQVNLARTQAPEDPEVLAVHAAVHRSVAPQGPRR